MKTKNLIDLLQKSDATRNNEPLVLQIHHKNGIFHGNTKENLNFLCPNCHSQTENYGRRKIRD